jgi:hypothetical protein
MDKIEGEQPNRHLTINEGDAEERGKKVKKGNKSAISHRENEQEKLCIERKTSKMLQYQKNNNRQMLTFKVKSKVQQLTNAQQTPGASNQQTYVPQALGASKRLIP